jgi:hypothetical protein
MAQASAISLSKFTSTVQAAVKAAVQRHPKFKVEAPQGITVAYLIRGFPVPDNIISAVSLGETQAFADDVAAHIANAHPEAMAAAAAPGQTAQGAILSLGRHVIIGIPPFTHTVLVEK